MRCQQRRDRVPSLPPELRPERSILRRQVLKIVDALAPGNSEKPKAVLPDMIAKSERPAGLPTIRTITHAPVVATTAIVTAGDGMKKCIECYREDGPLMVRRCVGTCGHLVCALCAPSHHCHVLLQRLQRESDSMSSSSQGRACRPIVYPQRATIDTVEDIIQQTADELVLTTADVMATNHSATLWAKRQVLHTKQAERDPPKIPEEMMGSGKKHLTEEEVNLLYEMGQDETWHLGEGLSLTWWCDTEPCREATESWKAENWWHGRWSSSQRRAYTYCVQCYKRLDATSTTKRNSALWIRNRGDQDSLLIIVSGGPAWRTVVEFLKELRAQGLTTASLRDVLTI